MPPSDLIKLDIQRIQGLEPGNVTLTDIGIFPWYSADIKLTTYVTSTRTYNVYSQTHQIIEIIPKQTPSLVTSSSISGLEKTAIKMIAEFSPDTNLDGLTFSSGTKGDGYYFFRWEDTSKKLDSGADPFVQVGVNGSSELLNYYNTLSLAK